MIRRLTACAISVLTAGLLSVAAVQAQPERAPAGPPLGFASAQEPPDTTERLPGTTLEAGQRDDDTSLAPWLIGSGVAAVAVVAIGGTVLKRRSG